MLVLTRKKDQSIMIGDDIEIVVVEIKGNQVKLGINAPRNVTVYRAEVWEEIQQENIAALQSASGVKEKLGALKGLFKKAEEKKRKKNKKNPKV
jgi:carbon storage regulator